MAEERRERAGPTGCRCRGGAAPGGSCRHRPPYGPDGLVVGTSGNVSVRVGDTVLVTPTGVPYDRLGPGRPVAVDLDGRRSSERSAHQRTAHAPRRLPHTAARAVVHTHAVHATAVSTLVTELPPIHYMTAALGGPVRVAPYATYGTAELAENMLRALDGRTACLLQNHGTVAYGDPRPGVRPHRPAGVDVPRLAGRLLRPRARARPPVRAPSCEAESVARIRAARGELRASADGRRSTGNQPRPSHWPHGAPVAGH